MRNRYRLACLSSRGKFPIDGAGGNPPALRQPSAMERWCSYNTMHSDDSNCTTKREPGDTTRLPMACSHEQAGAGGHPSARDSQLPKEDRLTYNTYDSYASSSKMIDVTKHTLREFLQVPLWHQPVLRAWPKRNLGVRSLSLLRSMVLLRIHEMNPSASFGIAASHCSWALGLSLQAVELRPMGERVSAPYRCSPAGWQLLCVFRSHIVIYFDHSPGASLSNTLLQPMLLNLPFMALKVYLLVMEDKRDEVKPRTSLAHRLAKDDRGPGHRASPLIYKKCRGTTPGSWRPPLSRRRHFYSITRANNARCASQAAMGDATWTGTHRNLCLGFVVIGFEMRVLVLALVQEGKGNNGVAIDKEVEKVATYPLLEDRPLEEIACVVISRAESRVIFKSQKSQAEGIRQRGCTLGRAKNIHCVGDGLFETLVNRGGRNYVICHTRLESLRAFLVHRRARRASPRHSPASRSESRHLTAGARSILRSLTCSSPQSPADHRLTQRKALLPGHKHRRAVHEPNVPKPEVPWFSPFASLVSVYAPCGQSPIVVDSLYGRSAA